MATEIHKFEAAGLGKAPFRFVGVNQNLFRLPDGSCKPGSSCDYCGTGITNEFWCVSADGHKFKVGCDCIYKIAAKTKLYSDVEKAERNFKREMKLNRDYEIIDAGKAKLAADTNLLTDKPHPSFPGKTLRDYADWMMKNAGVAGKLRVAKLIINEAN